MASDGNYQDLRDASRALCKSFGMDYWRKLDRTGDFPESFLRAFTEAGFISTLVPERDGGSGLGTAAGAAILEEIHATGADGAIAHAAMNAMTAFVRHADESLKAQWLPRILSGERRFISFGVTESEAGTDTTRINTTAVREGDHFRVNGRKIWISHAGYTDLMLLLVRTAPRDAGQRRSDGLSLLLVDASESRGRGLNVTPISTMVNHLSTECVFEDLRVPAINLVGEEGAGFRHILDGMNAERILIGAECIGDARWFIEQASTYAGMRRVFDRPIGQNQGVQFPIAQVYAETHAARLVVQEAAMLFDARISCAAESNIAKLLASKASYSAGDVCLQTFGGMGFATDADVERKFRESRLYTVAPVSNNLVLSYIAQQVLHLPRSY